MIDEQAAQCGYCYNGMIVKAAELLSKNPQPDDAQIRTAMNGHLCRCGTYPRIIRAIQRASRDRWRRAEVTAMSALPRREFLKAGGALVVGFSLRDVLLAQATPRAAPSPGPPDAKQIDTWLAIHADNTATVYIGFAELGQGTSTALLQIAAEELDLGHGPDQVRPARHQRDAEPGRHVLERVDRARRPAGAHGGRRSAAGAAGDGVEAARRRRSAASRSSKGVVVDGDGAQRASPTAS